MRLGNFLVSGCIAFAAPATTTEEPEVTTTTLADVQTTTVIEEDEEKNSGPIITVTPINEGANPLDLLIQKCDSWQFPESSFAPQTDLDKIYLEVADMAEGPFKNANITKFISVAGIRIVGQDSVPPAKVRHVGHVLAKILDHDQDGKLDNPRLTQHMLQFHPILFIMEDAEAIGTLMNAQLEDEEDHAFPMELKFCPYAFDFEESSKILPDGKVGDATCDVPGDKANEFDRAIPFVLDHLVGRGFNAAFTDEDKKQLKSIYESSVEASIFDPDSTGCPPDSEECGRVMFASWALSSLNGFDKCWCEQMEALKFCDSETLKNGEPELAELLTKRFGGLSTLPKGDYNPKDKSIIAASK